MIGPSNNPMEIDINGRHAQICRGHQIPLVGAHSSDKSSIADCIDCSIVSNCKIGYLQVGTNVCDSKWQQTKNFA